VTAIGGMIAILVQVGVIGGGSSNGGSTNGGGQTTTQQRLSTLSRLGERFDAAAIAPGATTCAEGSSFSGGLPSIG
jgi:hypothetical protein